MSFPLSNHAAPRNGAVIITGGAGFIGSHLAERLLAEGRPVVVVDDFSTGSRDNLAAFANHPRLRLVESPVVVCPDWEALVAEASTIYHLAAVVGVELVVQSPVRAMETNLDQTRHVIEAAARHRVPVLYTSSSEVYGRGNRDAFTEADDLMIGPPTVGRWSYACAKLMDEFLCLGYARERGLPVTIARLFNTVGARQTGRYGMVLPRFVTAAKAGMPLPVHGDGSQTRCFCAVQDTVEALLRLGACTAARGEVVNVGNDEEISIRHLAETVNQTLGNSTGIELIPYERAYQPGFEDMPRRKPALSKLEALTGYRPRTRLKDVIFSLAQVL